MISYAYEVKAQVLGVDAQLAGAVRERCISAVAVQMPGRCGACVRCRLCSVDHKRCPVLILRMVSRWVRVYIGCVFPVGSEVFERHYSGGTRRRFVRRRARMRLPAGA